MTHGFLRWAGLFLWLVLPAGLGQGYPEHPFVLIDTNELQTLRDCSLPQGWPVDSDEYLKKPIVIPSRGGHGHNFFCEDGTRLEFPDGENFAPGPYRCPKCHKIYSGQKYEDALRYYVHQDLAKAARNLALVGAVEHRPDCTAKAMEILLKYAGAYPGPHTDNLHGGITYQSLDESTWVILLAQAYDLVWHDMTPAQRSSVESFMRTSALGLENCGLRGNWGSWHLSAVGVVGYAIGDTNLVDWARRQFREQITDQLGDDGIWPESIHTYHFYALSAFCNFAEAAWHAHDDLYHWEGKPGKCLLSMFRAPLPYAYPDMRLPAINDGWFESYLPKDLYELAWHRTHEAIFASALKELPAPVEGIYTVLFGHDHSEGAAMRVASANFPGLGIAALRSDDGAMMTFHYGPFLGHGHQDKMSVTFFADGKLWSADYGTPGYGSKILSWYQSTFGHNTIIVDGKNEAHTTENNATVSLGATPEFVSSTTRQAYPGVTWTRAVERQRNCFVIHDSLSSEQIHTYDFYLHGEGNLSLDASRKNPQPAKAATPWIKDLTVGEAGPSITARWSSGGKGMAVWIEGAHPLLVMLGKCPAESGARQIPILIARQTGSNAEFVSVILPYREISHLSVQHQPHALLIDDGTRQETVQLPPQ